MVVQPLAEKKGETGMNRVKVTVAGRSYTLQTTDEAAYAEQLAKELDQNIRAVMRQNSSLSVSDACILTALDLMDRQRQESVTNDNLRRELQEYLARAKEAGAAASELKKKVAFLEAEKKRSDHK